MAWEIGIGKFLEIINNNMFEDIEILKDVQLDDDLCEACINGKQARFPYEEF